jgi:hypothetical protein
MTISVILMLVGLLGLLALVWRKSDISSAVTRFVLVYPPDVIVTPLCY